MPSKDTKKEEREIAEAAYWRVARPDLPIQSLADQLEVNRITLKRRIDEAIERGLITNDWIFKGGIPDQLWEVLSEREDKKLKSRIINKYGKMNLPKLTVVPAWPPKGDTSDTKDIIDETNRKMIARAAAHIFIKRLPQMEVIGLSYGRTLRVMVDMLEHYRTAVQSALEKDKSVTILTIIGSLSFRFEDERHGDWLEYSASHLTNRLARILGAKVHKDKENTEICKRRFLETPVYVPPAFLDQFTKKKTTGTKLSKISEKLSEGEALQIAKAFVEAIPTYHDVFGKGPESEIEKLDTVITSVGDLDTGFGSVPKGEVVPLLRESEIGELHKEAVGDIAGRYVTKDGETGNPGSTIAKVNDRIFGLTIEDLESIAQRAAKEKKPGVIVIASSRKKARVIDALLRRHNRHEKKVISELVISGDLAEELVK